MLIITGIFNSRCYLPLVVFINNVGLDGSSEETDFCLLYLEIEDKD